MAARLVGGGANGQASDARRRQRYSRPGQVPCDERSFTLTTLAVKSFGRLREEDLSFIKELAAHVCCE